MGIRYRKSINLGKGFRVNMSKSGPGFSWGTKGFRITRTAKGNIRGTASIPGTGLSYQKDFGNPTKKHQAKKANTKVSTRTNNENTRSFTNDLTNIKSADMADINSATGKVKTYNILACALIILGIILFFVNKYLILISVLGLGLLVYNKRNDKIRIDYDMTEEAKEELDLTNKFLAGIMESDEVWLVTQTEPADPDTRADMRIIDRSPINFLRGNDAIETNTETYTLDAGNMQLIFLPESLFIKENGALKGLSFKEIDMDLTKMTFLEEGRVPKDATVLGQTYLHTNKDGGPDKRYKDNPQMTLVEYGILSLRKQPGLDTMIVFSDTELDGK